ncbi:MAG: methyltransferase domain-containing protein [Methanolinea sp.]
MVEDYIIRRIDEERWKCAQASELEFARNTIESSDDWNLWWNDKFDDYTILNKRHFDNVLEVGCGPHTNIRYILPKITCKKLWLEDPLIQYYITYNLNRLNSFWFFLKQYWKNERVNFLLKIFSNLDLSVDLSSSKLENLPYRDNQMDLIICINVLDHVNDYDRCMQEIYRVLNTDGLLILGQDLSNQKDQDLCPESYTDIGHPIKLDHVIIEKSLEGKYSHLFKKILSREEGRNPGAHYGTFLGILQKCPPVS